MQLADRVVEQLTAVEGRTAGPRRIHRVHFVELNAKVNTLAVSPIFPKYGTPLLAAILRERGYEARIFLEGVSNLALDRIADCDAVCFPVFAPALTKVRALAQRLRAEHPGLPIIMGGPQVALFPETVLDVCDYAVRCEGDEVLPELLERLSTGEGLDSVRGVSYPGMGGIPVHCPDRIPPAVPATGPDLTLIEGFAEAARGARRHGIVNTLQTSRGCHFHCKFCPTSRLFGGSYRTRDVDSVIQDIRARLRYNRVFFVVDNSFLGDHAHAKELLLRLAREDLGAYFIVFERHQVGLDEEMLGLMKRAGVVCIIVGIESLADESLSSYDKRQTSEAVTRSVESILRHDLHVIGTFVLGSDSDTPASAESILRFVEATDISLNLFVVHDLEMDESKGLLIPLNRRFQTYYSRTAPDDLSPWDYLTGSFVSHFPKRMRPSTLQESTLRIYEQVFSHRRIARRTLASNLFEATFGVYHGYGVKRLTESIRAVVDGGYLDHLRRIEDGLYDGDEVLRDDRLAGLETLPLPPPLAEQANNHRYEPLIALMAAPGLLRSQLAMASYRRRAAKLAHP
ncbi:MAG TPA: radical SAM protein [Armatimonadota bacterium]|jgi:radical SAM superfamily enzyme YgiQ (UPF0313 family)